MQLPVLRSRPAHTPSNRNHTPITQVKPRRSIKLLPATSLATIALTLGLPCARAGWLPITGTNDYLATGNWASGTIDDDFPASLAFTGNQTATVGADRTTTAGMNFNYGGNYALTLRGDGGTRTLTLNGDVVLNTAGGTTANVTIGRATANQNLNLDLGGAARTFDIAANRTMTLANVISSGSGGLVKTGNGTLTCSGTNDFAGAVTVNAGTLRFYTSSYSGAITLSGGTLQYSNRDAQSYSTAITGAGSLNLNGAGLLTFTDANTYTGSTTLCGALELTGAGAITGTSSLALNGGSLQLVNGTTEGSVDRFKNTAATTTTGGSIVYTNTDGSALTYAEQIGNLTSNWRQTDVVLTHAMTGGSTQTLTMGSLARNNTSAVTFSNLAGLDESTNTVIVTNAATAAGLIFSPGVTVGTSPSAQTDYAVFVTAISNRAVKGAGIAASTQDTWTTAANAYTMDADATLDATRTITALRNTGGAHTLDLGANDLLTYGILNGDAGLLTINGTGSIKQQGTAASTLFLTAGAGDITINAPISNNTGALSLAKCGAGAVTLNGAVTVNTGNANTDVNAGSLIFSSTSTAALKNLNVYPGGTLTVSANSTSAGQVTVGSGLTIAASPQLIASGGAPSAVMTFNGGSATFGATRVGPDNSGNGASYLGHVFYVTAGTIDLGSSYLYVGGNSATGGGTGTLNISGASTVLRALTSSNHFDPGQGPGSVAYVNLIDGTLDFNYNNWGNSGGSAYGYQWGGNYTTHTSLRFGATGSGNAVYTLAGGAVNAGVSVVGEGADGIFNVLSGGTYNGAEISLGGKNEGALGVLNVAGGAVNTNVYVNNFNTSGVSLNNSLTNATGILNISAGGQLAMTGGISGSIGNSGTINLNGGTITYQRNASQINYSAQYDPFNPTKTWMGGFTHAFIFPGGITVDTGTYTGAFSQALEGATGTGVTGVTLTNGGGAGYQSQPTLSFTGGTLAGGVGTLGVEAQAVAKWDQSTGTITGVVVVCPGQYSVAPTGVVISGGGATTTATASLTTGSNSGGAGLTKTGSGSLTLSAAASYSGATTVSAGTLSLTGPNTNNDTSTVTIAATGATLNLNFVGTDTVGALVIGTDPPLAAGEYGATGSGADHELAQITGTGTLTVGGAAPSPFETWIGGYDFSGFANPDLTVNGDPEGDTKNNLLEFGFGTNPATSSTGPLAYTGGTLDAPGQPIVVEAGGTYYAVFCRRTDYVAAGLTYTVNFSAKLEPGYWDPSVAMPEFVATDGTIDVVRVPFPGVIPTPSGPQKARFFQVEVSMP